MNCGVCLEPFASSKEMSEHTCTISVAEGHARAWGRRAMKPVKSSTIKAIGYDESLRHMYVEFASGGTYRYEEVSPENFAAFEAAESIGKHHHAHIKGKFEVAKMPQKSEAKS